MFLVTVLTLLLLIHGFIAWHVLPLLPPAIWLRILAGGALLLLAVAYVAGRLMERSHIPGASAMLAVGASWYGFMVHLFLALLVLDVVVLANSWKPFLPQQWLADPVGSGRIVLAILSGAILLLLALGYANISHPMVRQLTLAVPGLPAGSAPFKIVVASDLHWDSLVPLPRATRIVKKINSLDPDLILLPGDIVDTPPSYGTLEKFRPLLQGLHARHGVYAVTGNHEFINGADDCTAFLESSDITVLRDSLVPLADGRFRLVGREDISAPRQSLADILGDPVQGKPVIVMDHQPAAIEEASRAGVALQVSGHTHHGQFWPFQEITKRLFRISHGHEKIGSSHFYVSCGTGVWGPQARTSSRSEIVLITLIPEI